MPDLITLVTAYYACAGLAIDGQLTQTERFDCNATYQLVKRQFLEDPAASAPTLSRDANTIAFLRFKAWEAENADLVKILKSH